MTAILLVMERGSMKWFLNARPGSTGSLNASCRSYVCPSTVSGQPISVASFTPFLTTVVESGSNLPPRSSTGGGFCSVTGTVTSWGPHNYKGELPSSTGDTIHTGFVGPGKSPCVTSKSVLKVTLYSPGLGPYQVVMYQGSVQKASETCYFLCTDIYKWLVQIGRAHV